MVLLLCILHEENENVQEKLFKQSRVHFQQKQRLHSVDDEISEDESPHGRGEQN